MPIRNFINEPVKFTDYPIAIKTSWGEYLGMGHFQRMTSLLWYLNEIKNLKTFLITEMVPDSFPAELTRYIRNNIDFQPRIIIRDMRDSSEDEIRYLKEACKVLTIDDNGNGRLIADYSIDILPNPEKEKRKQNSYNNKNIFLYGYNFTNALIRLNDRTIKKHLDFAIYPGNSADKEKIDFFSSLLPEQSNYAILSGKDAYTVINGKKNTFKESSYAETILASKSVISHFGITLYEGFISKCNLFAINPTPYHSKLTDMAKNELCMINLGTYDEINKDDVATVIKKAIESPLCEEINAEDVRKRILNNLEEFYQLLISLL